MSHAPYSRDRIARDQETASRNADRSILIAVDMGRPNPEVVFNPLSRFADAAHNLRIDTSVALSTINPIVPREAIAAAYDAAVEASKTTAEAAAEHADRLVQAASGGSDDYPKLTRKNPWFPPDDITDVMNRMTERDWDVCGWRADHNYITVNVDPADRRLLVAKILTIADDLR